MPSWTGAVSSDGALVNVRIGWSDADVQQQRAALRPVPPDADFRAVLDTGAEITCHDTRIVRQLGLPVEGVTIANVPAVAGLTYGMQYRARLLVLHPSGNAQEDLAIDGLVVVELALAVLGYQALSGRDVLSLCDFFYSGRHGTFTLTY
jgi:hypothetical protein